MVFKTTLGYDEKINFGENHSQRNEKGCVLTELVVLVRVGRL